MMYRITMDVGQQGSEISIVFNGFTAYIINEQSSLSVEARVECFGIAVTKIAELLHHKGGIIQTGVGYVCCSFQLAEVRFQLALVPNTNQHMKVIRHQAIRIRVGYWQNISGVSFQKKVIVIGLSE